MKSESLELSVNHLKQGELIGLYNQPKKVAEHMIHNGTACYIWSKGKELQNQLPKAQEEFSKPNMRGASEVRARLLQAAAELHTLYGVPVEISLYGETASFNPSRS